MKKIVSIAATLCMATAFCGFCSGCAAEAQNGGKEEPHVPQSVSQTTDTDYKVILNPGWYYAGSTKTDNTITDAGVTKMTKTEAEAAVDGYYVDNAYFATVAAGENLPVAETTRTGMTFGGWWYAKDGEVIKVTTMPSDLDGHLYLYAQWNVADGSGGQGSGGQGSGGDVTTGAAVNGNAMLVNDQNDDATVETEYMVLGVQLPSGTALSFTVDGASVTLTEVEQSSSGITKNNPASVQTTKSGPYNIYLKKLKAGGWRLYAVCNSATTAVNCETGKVYLVGVVDSASLTWGYFDAGGENKGIEASGSGTSYTLTVDLTAGDNCKFVMYDSVKNNRKWQNALTGGGSNIELPNKDANMSVKVTGNYTFTVTVSGSNLSVSVVKNS